MNPLPDNLWPAHRKSAYGMADLLNRPEMFLDKGHFRTGTEGKRILITGAAGSIGSELSHQLLAFNPEALILVDCNESGLAAISEELQRLCGPCTSIKPYPRNICMPPAMDDLMGREKPDWVFHTAAYKHVSFLEEHLVDAAWTNIAGTKTVLDAATQAGAERFVFLSTDKAVYPSSVMGLTKRFCERMLAGYAPKPTACLTARLVNVLGSRGSVVPRFEKQLRQGFVDITHPGAERYFVTPFEATQLLLESAITGVAGDTLRFEISHAQNITQLASKIAKCQGVDMDGVRVNYTNMRGGEKLAEVLQYPDEIDVQSESAWVRRLRSSALTPALTEQAVNDVLKACTYTTAGLLRSLLEHAVPEYQMVTV